MRKNLLPGILFFSFILLSGALLAQSPGGVAGSNLWLKANAGITNSGTNLTGWTDQTGTNTFTKVGTLSYNTNTVNFNPVVSINNNGQPAVPIPTNRLDGNTPIQAVEAFGVFKTNSNTNATVIGSTITGSSWGPAIFGGLTNNRLFVTDGNANRQDYTNSILTTQFSINSFDVSPTANPYCSAFINGQSQSITPVGSDFSSVTLTPMIGGTENGSNTTAWLPMYGDIAEIILYPTGLSSTQKAQVQSYLAIKYGITLHNSVTHYLASDGTTVLWNNTTYWHDVFGIGKDDASGLNQTQSNSINTGTGDGSGQSGKGNIVMSNPSGMTDGEFLMMGHNNAALTEQSTEVPTAGQKRIAREWFVKRTNDPGTVNLSFDILGLTLSGTVATDFKLLIDADGDFSSGATEVNAASLTGTKVEFTGVTIPDGSYLTIVTESPSSIGPGVLGASLWLKANDGASPASGTLTAWTDQTGTNTFTVSGNPQTGTTAFNFNNAIDFDGDGDYLTGNAPIKFQTLYAVIKRNQSLGTNQGSILASATPSPSPPSCSIGLGLMMLGDRLRSGNNTCDPFLRVDVDSDGSLGTNLRLGVVELVNGPPNQSKSYIDGSFHAMSQSNNTQGTTMTIDQVVPLVGRFADATFPSYFHGQIAEMIMYPASHNDVDRRKIESYLAIKYGITLDEAGVSTYVNSSGGAVWSNSLFWHDVFGIGKDDGSGLNQPSSNSINTGSGDGTGQSGKGNIVLKNASSLDDGDFLMIGHDNGALTEQTNDIPNSLPGGTNGARRLGREWKVRHTGNVGTVTLEFDLTGLTVTGTVLGHFILLIDEDGNGNFNNGTVTQVPASAFGSVIFNNVTLPNNAVLALVTYNPGVILPLNLLSFDANTKNCSSLITWKTSNEVNVDRFELQVSVDNNSWYTIQTVSATNGSQDVNTYSFNYDHSAQGGNKLVRLKMVDMDGKVSYSRIISVQCGKDNIFTLYPNPAYDQVTLTGTRAGDLVMVLTMDGKRVRSQSATQGNTRIGLEGLPAGTYVIQVAREGLLMPAGNMVKQ